MFNNLEILESNNYEKETGDSKQLNPEYCPSNYYFYIPDSLVIPEIYTYVTELFLSFESKNEPK